MFSFLLHVLAAYKTQRLVLISFLDPVPLAEGLRADMRTVQGTCARKLDQDLSQPMMGCLSAADVKGSDVLPIHVGHMTRAYKLMQISAACVTCL